MYCWYILLIVILHICLVGDKGVEIPMFFFKQTNYSKSSVQNHQWKKWNIDYYSKAWFALVPSNLNGQVEVVFLSFYSWSLTLSTSFVVYTSFTHKNILEWASGDSFAQLVNLAHLHGLRVRCPCRWCQSTVESVWIYTPIEVSDEIGILSTICRNPDFGHVIFIVSPILYDQLLHIWNEIQWRFICWKYVLH